MYQNGENTRNYQTERKVTFQSDSQGDTQYLATTATRELKMDDTLEDRANQIAKDKAKNIEMLTENFENFRH